MAKTQEEVTNTDPRQLLSLERVLPLTVIAGSALYFTGSEYLDAKAVGLGLASAPGEPSLHKTMAFGASILFQPASILTVGLFLFGSLFFILGVLHVVRKWVLPRDIHEQLVVMGEGAIGTIEQFRARVEGLRATANEADPAQRDDDAIRQELDALEAEVEAEYARYGSLKKKTSFRLRVSSILVTLAKGVPAGLFFGLIISLGSSAGELAANETKNAVQGDCEDCFTFSSGPTEVTGIAVFQSDDMVVVASRDGVVIFPAGEPIISRNEQGPVSEQAIEGGSEDHQEVVDDATAAPTEDVEPHQ